MLHASDFVDFIAPQDGQPPIWLFDLGSKSFYFGLQGHMKSSDSNHKPDSIPTIFALPRPSTPSHTKQQTSQRKHTSKDQEQLTVQNRSQVPAGPSNLSTFASRYESWEHIAMGQSTNRSEESMAGELAVWETCWQRIGGS
jgi:hypothetical protein